MSQCSLSQATTIPDRFSGLQSYLDSFRIPLLEEMRAEMSSNLESLPDNHPSTAVPIRALVPIVRGKGVRNSSLAYQATVDRRRGGACAPCIGDILVLVDAVPRRPADLARNGGGSYCLARVNNVSKDRLKFGIRASRKIEDESSYAFAASLLSFIPYARIWRCLDYDEAMKRGSPALVRVVAGEAPVSSWW
jgi:senataxin